MKSTFFACIVTALLISGCGGEPRPSPSTSTSLPVNVLDYIGSPESPADRTSLAFSDQGAWFAYGFSNKEAKTLGFTGPFLMTQGQGEWCSEMLSHLELYVPNGQSYIDMSASSVSQNSYSSHLHQVFENASLHISQTLFFTSPHSALITTEITNRSEETMDLVPSWKGELFQTGMHVTDDGRQVSLITDRSPAKGLVQTFHHRRVQVMSTDSSYAIFLAPIHIRPGETSELRLGHTFIFPEYDSDIEQTALVQAASRSRESLRTRIDEKEAQQSQLEGKLDSTWREAPYRTLLSKTLLTLQNNSRIAAGELKHDGLFPSYHYKWFLGMWAWDSWKHSAALAHYDTELAKNQIRAMYDFQLPNGFIVDCVFRDTTIENHNYRNTKPPLSAWAVWNVFQQDGDVDFVKEMYPSIQKQHQWWYSNRDSDQDGICEYGSTDGTLQAAKWESGMDNAVRFDDSEMVRGYMTTYSINQESVDLNAYLYAEKRYLMQLAEAIDKSGEAQAYAREAEALKVHIQTQFFDKKTGWFYDTSLDGKRFIDVMGCEGWIPLWANVATAEQAHAVRQHMMDPEHFNTKVPFQTLSARHPKFQPNGGYWRGPNWLDQAYFGVVGLHNYGFHEDAYAATLKLIHNAEGVLSKGKSIRENYQPITGAGLESENFSWSAAHYMLLLLEQGKEEAFAENLDSPPLHHDVIDADQRASEASCTCSSATREMAKDRELSFSNNGTAFDMDELIQWQDNPERLEITSLVLIDFDTIPAEMAMFENVERVYLRAINNKDVQGLECFENLRFLVAEEERFNWTQSPPWLDQLEEITTNKSMISGLGSFKELPSLRKMKLSFSGFDTFPADFASLSCLNYFQSGAHTFCDIDLSQLNFSEMPCLEFVEFQSWKRNLTGIPTGSHGLETLKVSHPNMTAEEKALILRNDEH